MHDTAKVFDYRALRLLMGLIAFMLPILVSLISADSLSSISASYHTGARDAFVGLLFVVAAFLFAYRGHDARQSLMSKIASVAAILVAVFPTKCDGCETGFASYIHYGAAIVLFSILSYFCFIFFQKNIRGKPGMKARRSRIYSICGSVMIGSMLGMGAAFVFLSDEVIRSWRVIYLGELVALFAFGVAWMVSGKFTRLIADENEKFHIHRKVPL